MLFVTGEIDVSPEDVAPLLEAALPLMEAVQAEDGNIDYVFVADPLVPGRVRIFERWESHDHLRTHMGQPHMATFSEKMQAFEVRGRSLTIHHVESSEPFWV